ncbi:hypothetical protein [Streptomyces sp. NPDC001537]
MTVKVPLKETALNAERIARIGREVQAVCPEFDADSFVTSVMGDHLLCPVTPDESPQVVW